MVHKEQEDTYIQNQKERVEYSKMYHVNGRFGEFGIHKRDKVRGTEESID